ncbi:hypothetical protein EME01_63320 [Sinorhizobium meliloti]|nr:hypothetical protein EME01_63320 [Sinorhizobium meliloti]
MNSFEDIAAGWLLMESPTWGGRGTRLHDGELITRLPRRVLSLPGKLSGPPEFPRAQTISPVVGGNQRLRIRARFYRCSIDCQDAQHERDEDEY